MTCECTATVHSSRLGVFFFLFIIKEDCYFSLFLHEIVGFGYSLEGPQRGASNEYPQPTFTWRIRNLICGDPSSLELWIDPLIWSYDSQHVQIDQRNGSSVIA